MSTAVAKGLYHLRRFLWERMGLLLGGALAWLLVEGHFERIHLSGQHWMPLATLGFAGALLLVRLALGRAQPRAGRTELLDRLEVGVLLLAVVFAGVQAAGGPEMWAQAAVYLAVAYLVGFNQPLVGVTLTLVALLFQLGLHHAAGDLPDNWEGAAARSGLIVLFATANMIFLQAEVRRRRLEHRRRLDAEIKAMREEARDFRLVSPAQTPGEAQDRAAMESKLARGAVEAIHQSMFFVLELLKKSLDLQTCILLWLDSTGQKLKIKELVTDSNMVRELPLSAQAGALGGVVTSRLLLNLRQPRQSSRGIAYYAGPEQVGAFLGVPVLEDGHLRGVLCADRREDRPFSEAEEQLMVQASRQVLRAIQSERVFAAVERSKYEHERFYRASSMLNSALTLSQVYDTAFVAAREIAEFEFGAITLLDRQRKKHIICRVLGEDRERFEGHQFGLGAGLVSMVVKNKHFLPAADELRERDPVVFTKKLRLRGMGSLVVLPLIVQDVAIGTFVLAARPRGRFTKKIREMLGVISNQVAVSIENAKMYKQMEEMATTDGLTGLPNHRTFQARLSEMLYRAERHGKPVSVVLIDLDHFKSVNDTYGHPVGDVVLKRLASVLANQIRKVDLVARYGGEEFTIVLEETDSKGAWLFCERVRQEVAAQVMSSDKGAFRVTLSLGIATYPFDGKEKQVLIERADQALYAAKQGGRNRTILYADLQKAKHRHDDKETVRPRHQCASP